MVSEFGYASSTAPRISSVLRGGSADSAREDSPLSVPSDFGPSLDSLLKSPKMISSKIKFYKLNIIT